MAYMRPTTALTLLLLASIPAHAGPPELPIAAFTSNQVWSTDNGGTIARLGWPQQAVLVVRPGSSRPSILKTPDRCCLYEASLAPSRDLIAYSVIGPDSPRMHNDESGWSVVVVDTAGAEVARMVGGRRFRWSPDGGRLAVTYAHHDTNWTWTPDAIGLWRRSDGARRRLLHAAEDLCWGAGDTLYLMVSDRVVALDLAHDRPVNTHRRGPDPSPDGRYSIRHYTSVASGARLFDDRDSLDLSHCTLYRHNAVPLGGFQPFWLRGAGHLMCTVGGEGVSAPPAQAGLRTGIFDPRTLEMVAWFAGKPIVPTADGRGVVVVRGDTLAVEPLAAVREPPRDGRTVRIRMDVHVWGRDVRLLGTWIHEVAEGEWLPDHAYMSGACESYFRIARIVDRDSAQIEVPPGRFRIGSAAAPGVEGGRATVSRAPTHLRTNSADGGYTIDLSIVD